MRCKNCQKPVRIQHATNTSFIECQSCGRIELIETWRVMDRVSLSYTVASK